MNKILKRQIALLLVLAMCMGFAVPPATSAIPLSTSGAQTNGNSVSLDAVPADGDFYSPRLPESYADSTEKEPAHAADDIVRVSIVLDKASTLAAGYSAQGIANNAAAMLYRENLKTEQKNLQKRIEDEVLNGEALDVAWNMTLAANIISANVKYGQMEAIADLDGVKEVFLENQYAPAVLDEELADNPNMTTSSAQIGSTNAWAAGCTGAGRRIAIIDTGIDDEHISFNNDAFLYSLKQEAAKKGMDIEEYKKSLNLLTEEDIEELIVSGKLNVYGFDSKDLYKNEKIPYGFNYVDWTIETNHKATAGNGFYKDKSGEHGSHVAGIAAANAYVPKEGAEGEFEAAEDAVHVKGVAPNAQIIVMKVFGAKGGAYDSDYFVALEDAILLGCDAANLSLGSAYAGWGVSNKYDAILAELEKNGLVMVASAGNNGKWADNVTNIETKDLYADDVNFHTGGSPGTFSNAFTVASVDNAGGTGPYIKVGEQIIFYSESMTGSDGTAYKNPALGTIKGDYEFIYMDCYGTQEEFNAMKDQLNGKVALVNRGGNINFSDKANRAAEAGAKALIVVNNQAGIINMDLSTYTGDIPVVSITMENGGLFKNSTAQTQGDLTYYTGSVTIGGEDDIVSTQYNKKYNELSSFSSWGIPQTLTMKPEITAPGGNIYSVNGAHWDEKQNELAGDHKSFENMSGTSMAAPQITGMVALLDEFLQENHYDESTKLKLRTLAQSLLMSTAVPIMEENNDGYYYSILGQGAGLANIGAAIIAQSYILMGEDATESYADGKVKAELGANESGEFSYSFTINNLNGKTNTYTLSTDMFTQNWYEGSDGESYLSSMTKALQSDIVYIVDGQTFIPRAAVQADVNRDGITDGKDAQAILDYIVGKEVKAVNGEDIDLTVADLDGDNKYTSYDAHLLLANMETEAFTVPAGGKVEVEVQIKITEDLSAAKAKGAYTDGAYVEGFTYVNPVSSSEGDLDVTHSIPILGFWGNWSDPAMFDRTTYAESLYGLGKTPYVLPGRNVGTEEEPQMIYGGNQFTISDGVTNGGNAYYYIGNPYGIEKEFPYDKGAVRSTDTLAYFDTLLIRNAAALAYMIRDVDTNEIIYISTPISYQALAAYYSGSAWTGLATLSVYETMKWLGVKPNQRVELSVVAIPEYFLDEAMTTGKAEPKFFASSDEVKALVESGVLGDGCFYTTKLNIDDEAPKYVDASKNLTTGALTVTVEDNFDVSWLGVVSYSGAVLYESVLAPEENEDGTVTYTFSTDNVNNDLVGSRCVIVICDYAGNQSAYVVNYGGKDPNFNNQLFAYVYQGGKSYGNGEMEPGAQFDDCWAIIDLDNIGYDEETKEVTGIDTLVNMGADIYGAEYIDGNVFFLLKNNLLYTAPLADLENVKFIAQLSSTSDRLSTGESGAEELAYSSKDGKLYMMTGNGGSSKTPNPLYEINPITGVVTTVAYIDAKVIENRTSSNIEAFTIDDEGNFYGVTNGGSTTPTTHLVKWRLDDEAADKARKDANGGTPIISITKLADLGKTVQEHGGTMTWNHKEQKIYLANGSTAFTCNIGNGLYVIDPDANPDGNVDDGHNIASCEKVNDKSDCIYASLRGLFFAQAVYSGNMPDFKPTDEVESIEISDQKLDLNVTNTAQLGAHLLPWNLSDDTVVWSSSDESVATVNQLGIVTAIAAGTAEITATPKLEEGKTGDVKTATCTVTVKALPDLKENITALAYVDGVPTWVTYNLKEHGKYTKLEKVSAPSHNYLAGTLAGDTLYYHDGDNLYAVDPDTFEETDMGEYYFPFIDAAPTSLFEGDGFEFVAIVPFWGNYMLILGGNDMAKNNAGNGWAVNITNRGQKQHPTLIARYSVTSTTKNYTTINSEKFYVLTEEGYLYKDLELNDLGMVKSPTSGTAIAGLDLRGIASRNEGYTASMVYDETSERIILTSTLGNGTTKVQIIDPSKNVLEAAYEFDADKNVSMVVGNYQYKRNTDTHIVVDKTEVTVYEGRTTRINAKLKFGAEGENITWTSNNTSVATVDSNGLITGVKGGTATITGTANNCDSVTVTVNVVGKNLIDSDIYVGAQIVDKDGAHWAHINLKNLSVTTDADTAFIFDSGTVYNGSINAFSGGGVYELFPKTFIRRNVYGYVNSYWGTPNDATVFTELKWEMDSVREQNEDGTYKKLTGSFPDGIIWSHFASGSGRIVFQFPGDSSKNGSTTLSNKFNPVAIAYGGKVDANNTGMKDKDGNDVVTNQPISNEANVYYFLNPDGTLCVMLVYAKRQSIRNDNVTTEAAIYVLGNSGLNIPIMDPSSITMEGFHTGSGEDGTVDTLIIANYKDDLGETSLYYVSLTGEDCTAKYMGTLDGVSYISCMYSDDDYEAPAATLTGLSGKNETAASDAADNSDDVPDISAVPYAPAEEQTQPAENTVPEGVELDEENRTVTLHLTAKDLTNLLQKVTYDPDILTLKAVTGMTFYNAWNSGNSGEVKVAFAEKDIYSGAVADLIFTYSEDSAIGFATDLIVTTAEQNEDVSLKEEEILSISVTTVFDVIVSGEHMTSTAPGTVTGRTELSFTLTPDDGYHLPETIDVTVAGKTLTADQYSYSPVGGTVTIPAEQVVGTVSVSVQVEMNQSETTEKVSVSVSVDGGTANAPETLNKGDALKFTVTPNSGYNLPDKISVSVGGKALSPDAYTYDKNTGEVTVPGEQTTGDIVVTVKCMPKGTVDPSTPPETNDINSLTWITLSAMLLLAVTGTVAARKKQSIR